VDSDAVSCVASLRRLPVLSKTNNRPDTYYNASLLSIYSE